MSECQNCGRPIRQTDGGTWVHDASGRGICAWAEPSESSRCVKCGGPDGFHDPACIVHPESGDPS